MTGIPRVLVDWTLVVALAAAAFTACASSDRGPVPPTLVGVWHGGSHSNGDWYYEFSADGRYRAWPARSPGTVNTGTVVVTATTMTFSNGGVPVTSTWSVSDGLLVLDGTVYERADVP
jgi:hypothetical protein